MGYLKIMKEVFTLVYQMIVLKSLGTLLGLYPTCRKKMPSQEIKSAKIKRDSTEQS